RHISRLVSVREEAEVEVPNIEEERSKDLKVAQEMSQERNGGTGITTASGI
ncbi:hypothetical protein SK128_000265, partial [Halocaridina rubra]